MSQDHIEAMLVWSASGPSPDVERWLADRGLEVMPMRAGLLIAGRREIFETAFGVDLEGRQYPISLPAPDAIRDAVTAISIRRPPHYNEGG